MTNVDEERDEERGEPSEAVSPDLQEITETTGTTESSEVLREDDSGPSPAASPAVEVSNDDASAIDESSASEGAPDGAEDEAPIAPVTVMEQRGHRIGVELMHVETEVRALLQDRDPKRKRKLTGNARWQELEDDVIALRYSGRIDEPTLAQVRQLIARRKYLFAQLAFVAGTRPTWNT